MNICGESLEGASKESARDIMGILIQEDLYKGFVPCQGGMRWRGVRSEGKVIDNGAAI
jgi:hypothetical protein